MDPREIAKFLINPLLYVFSGLIIILLCSGKRRMIGLLMVTAYLYLISIPYSAIRFTDTWKIKDTFNTTRYYDGAVILSGYAELDWYSTSTNSYHDSNNYFRFSSNVDRLLAGIRLVKTGHAKKLFIGARPGTNADEGTIARAFAVQQGLTVEQIIIYGTVNRTLDEAREVKAYTNTHGIRHLLLVTSQIHMRRALAMFRRYGLNPDTYAVHKNEDELVTDSGGWNLFVPSVKGIRATQNCLYELVAFGAYYSSGDLVLASD